MTVVLTISNVFGSVVIITVVEHYFSECCLHVRFTKGLLAT